MRSDNCYAMSVIGNKDGLYISPCTCYAYIDITEAENYSQLNTEGMNGGVIYRYPDGKFYVCQVGGYTEERGAYCDLYDDPQLHTLGNLDKLV